MLEQGFFNGAADNIYGALIDIDKLIVRHLKQTAVDQRYRRDSDDFRSAAA